MPDQPKPRRWRTSAERTADNAAAQARVAAAEIETQRARAQAEHERLENERELLRVQAEVDEQRQRLADERADRLEAKLTEARRARWNRLRNLSRRVSLAVVLASANVGVNAVAVVGQVLALTIGLGWPLWAAIPVALVVESVAVNVGYFAHDKLIKGYSAIGLRLLSYGIGSGVGWFNYSHNDAHEHTADYAGVFGAASLLSPVLWQIYSQWRHWDQMRGQDLLETRAPKFTKARWILWAGETFFVYRRAVRDGIGDRAEAVSRYASDYERHRTAKPGRGRKNPDATGAPAAADELAAALNQWSKDYRNTADLDATSRDRNDSAATEPPTEPRPAVPAPRRTSPVRPGSIRPVGHRIHLFTVPQPNFQPLMLPPLASEANTPTGRDQDATESRPAPKKNPTDADKPNVVGFWVERVKAGEYLSKYDLAACTGFGATWCGDRITEGRPLLAAEGWTFDARSRPVPPAATSRVNGSSVAR